MTVGGLIFKDKPKRLILENVRDPQDGQCSDFFSPRESPRGASPSDTFSHWTTAQQALYAGGDVSGLEHEVVMVHSAAFDRRDRRQRVELEAHGR